MSIQVFFTSVVMVLFLIFFFITLYKSTGSKSFYFSLFVLFAFFFLFGKLQYYGGSISEGIIGMLIYSSTLYFMPVYFLLFMHEYRGNPVENNIIKLIIFIPAILNLIWIIWAIIFGSYGETYFALGATDEYTVYLVENKFSYFIKFIMFLEIVYITVCIIVDIINEVKGLRKPSICMLLMVESLFISVVYSYFSKSSVEYIYIGFLLCFVFGMILILKYDYLKDIDEYRIGAINKLDECFIFVDNNNIIQHFNESAKKILPELKNTNKFLNFKELHNIPCDKILDNDDFDFDIMSHKGRRYYRSSIRNIYNKDNEKKGKSILIYNTTEIKKIINDLEHMSVTDYLTNLKNRRYFFESFECIIPEIFSNNGSISVAIFDLDNFKKINDTYGHNFGDQVLIIVAKIFKKNIRSTDIACRYGGEEFAMFFPYTELIAAEIIANRIRKALKDEFILNNDNIIKITISGGVTTFNKDNFVSVSKSLEMADKLLYHSKENGKDQITAG